MTDEEKECIAKERNEAVEKIMAELLPQLAAIGPLSGFRLIVKWDDGFQADSFMAHEEKFRAAQNAAKNLAQRNPKNN